MYDFLINLLKRISLTFFSDTICIFPKRIIEEYEALFVFFLLSRSTYFHGNFQNDSVINNDVKVIQIRNKEKRKCYSKN